MKVASDLGGVSGYGPVQAERDEPVFHDRWESRVLALTLAMGATRSWTLDRSRFAREDRPREEYVSIRYYDLWFRALERLLLESGLVTPDEVASGVMSAAPLHIERLLAGSDVDAVLSTGSPVRREPTAPARFSVGDTVTTSQAEPSGHTRLPTYARGKRGRISAVDGCYVFPDTNAHGLGEKPQWLYTVEFTAQELFGAGADPRSVVSVDAFEPYLEAQ
jgi:nitrile hydratase subunit beta